MNFQLRATLESLNARAMVVGHTPQMSGVNCECDGRVWRVDAGMSSGVLDAAPQVRCGSLAALGVMIPCCDRRCGVADGLPAHMVLRRC